MSNKQAQLFYEGVVQGVGFRYRTLDMAEKFNLNGWVRNLPDGRVEIVVIGPEDDISGFMERLESSFGEYIRNKELIWHDKMENIKGFTIKF